MVIYKKLCTHFLQLSFLHMTSIPRPWLLFLLSLYVWERIKSSSHPIVQKTSAASHLKHNDIVKIVLYQVQHSSQPLRKLAGTSKAQTMHKTQEHRPTARKKKKLLSFFNQCHTSDAIIHIWKFMYFTLSLKFHFKII